MNKMKELQDRILKDGQVIGTNILKVNKFINHQVNPVLMEHIGEDFANHFAGKGITKVVTIELRNCSCTYGSSQDECTACYFKEAAFKDIT